MGKRETRVCYVLNFVLGQVCRILRPDGENSTFNGVSLRFLDIKSKKNRHKGLCFPLPPQSASVTNKAH